MSRKTKGILSIILTVVQISVSWINAADAATTKRFPMPITAVLPAWSTSPAPSNSTLPSWFSSATSDPSPDTASLLPTWFDPPAAPPAAPIPGLEVTVTAPESVSAGDFYGDTYTVTIRNPCNPITATNLSITATIPASGFTYLEGSAVLVSSLNGAITVTDAYTDPLVVWTPATPYDLLPCDMLTLTFRLTTDGDAVSGQRLDVNAVYENPPGDPGRTNGGTNVTVGRGNLYVEKSPSIQDATYGDVIVWTVEVGNTGLGTVYSTTLSDDFGAGYTNTDASELAVPPFHLAIGERRTFPVTATVNSCNNLTNTALAAWNIGNEEGDGTAANPVSDTVDVAYLLESPDIALAGNSLVFEYCTPASKTVVVTATNSGGPALDFLLDSNITGTLPFVVGNVDARWSYDAGSGLFTYLENGGVLAAGQQLSLTFVVTPTFDVCTGDGGDGALHFQAQYDDPCGLHFDGRSTGVDYQYGSGDLPDLSVAKTSSDRYVYTGDTLQFYVDFEAINVQNISGTVVITDNVPLGFAVTGASAPVGIITQIGNLLLWTIPVSGTGDRSGRMTISATVVDDAGLCEAYSARTNTAQASAAVTCPTCPPLTASDAAEVIIQNTTGMAQPKSMTSDFQVCGAIAASNHYTVTVGDWSGVVFTETLGHDDGVPADDVPPGTLTYQPGSLSVVVDGIDVTAEITLVQTSPQLVLDFGGITLVPTGTRAITIAYSLYISDDVLAGAPEISFFDWSAFAVPGSGSCTNDNTLYQGVDVTLRRADLQIDISPDSFVGCETVPVVLTVSDPDLVAEGLVAENIVVTFTVGSPDFGSIDTGNFSYGGGFAGNPVTVTVGSNVITWTFQNPLTQTGTTSGSIAFSMTRSCGSNPLSASVHFDDRCGVTYSNADANNDPVEAPDVRLFVTPDTYVVNENVARWRMYLTNVGDGIAGRVLLTDTLGTGLRFISYTTDYPAQVNRLTAPPFDPGEDIVWQVLNLAPGQQVRFDVYADVVGCTDLTSQVTMDSSCLDGTCPSSGTDGLAFSRPSVAVRSSNDQTADLPFCDIGEVLLTVKNASVSAHVYQMVITETIHALIYIPGSARITVTNQSGTPYPGLIDVPFEPVTTVVDGDTILLWSLDNPGLTVTQTDILADRAPEDSIVIRYQLQTDCSSPGANWVQAEAGGIQPCGQFFFRRESAVTLDIDEPEISLSKEGRNVTKGDTAFAATVYAEPGDTLVWRVTANNVFGAYVAQNVVITDTAPLNFQITRAATATIGGGALITSSSAVTWNLGLLPADGLDRVLLITGTVTSAPDSCQLLTTNRAGLEYGCDDGCRAEPIQASANLRTRPSMQVQVADLPQFHRCGGIITLTLTNNGPPAYDVVLTDTLPTGFYYQETVYASMAPSSLPVVGAAAPVWTWSGGISLPTGVTTLTFRVNSGTGGDCSDPSGGSNEVEILYDDILTCTVTGPYLASGSGSVTIVSPTLVLAKTPALQTTGEGQVVTWTIWITNTGAAEAPNVVVTDTLGAGFAEGGRVITWSVGALAAISGTWSAIVTATVAASGGQTNSVRASGSCDAGCIYAAATETAYVTLVDEFAKGPPIQTGTIGSLTVFTFTTTLPDQSAIYRHLTLTDTLPAGLGYVSSMLTTTYGIPGPGATTLISATPTITPGWLQSGAVVWRLGDLDGAVQIDGVVTAVIRNVAGNQDGARRSNEIAMTYFDDGQPYVYTDTAAVDVLEPNLALDKQVASSTGSPNNLDGTASLTYTLVITSDGGWPAFDVLITDVVPAGVLVTAVYGGEGHSPAAAHPLTWTFAAIPTATVRVVSYTAIISHALPGATLTNVATATWSSTPDDPVGQERDGSDGPGGPLDDYADRDDASIDVASIGLVKTSQPITRRVGDGITYTVVFSVPAGTVGMGGDSHLVDTLPPGVQYITASESLAWTPASVAVATTGRAVDFGAPAQVITWTFGTPITSTQDAPTVVTLTFQAQATGLRVNDGAAVWPDQTAPYAVVNTVDLWQQGTPVDTDTASNDVIQPSLSIAKSSAPPSGVFVGAGDTITYTLAVVNDGRAPAYDLIVTDTLPAGIDYIRTISAPNPASAVITAQVNGSQLSYAISELAAGPGATMLITVVARVTDTIGADLALTNTTAAPYYDSQPGPGPGLTPTQRTYTGGADAVVHHTAHGGIVKSVIPAAATLGDVITYVIVIPPAPITATLYNVIVTDQLDPRLQLQAVTDSPDGVVLTASNSVTVTYAEIARGEQQTLTVTAVLSHPLGAAAGDAITNQAVLSHRDGGPTPSNVVTTTVIEPDLTLTKDADPPGGSIVGENAWITYTIAVTNAAGADVSPAYDLVLWDTLPNWMRATPPTLLALTIDGSTVPTSSQRYDAVSGLWVITVTPGVSLPVGGRLVLTYLARVDASAPSGLALTNDAQAGYSSLPDDAPDDRDYTTNRDDETHYTPIATGLLKFAAPSPVAVGSRLVYTYQIPSSPVSATLHNIVFTDAVPANLTVTSVSGDGGFVSGWTGGNLVTGTVASIPALDRVIVTVTTTVRDIPANFDGSLITNTATIDYSGNPNPPSESNTVTTTVRWADIAVTKTVTPPTVASGNQVTFTLAYTNVGPVAAENVTLTDTLPAGLSYSHAAPSPDSVAGQEVAWHLGSLAAGQNGSILLVATVDATSATYAVLTNTVLITTTTRETNTTNNDDSASTVLTQTCDVSIAKTARPPAVVSNDTLTYTLAYANAGPADAAGTVITDVLPSGLTFAGCDPATCLAAGQTVAWSLGTVPAGASGVLTLYASVDLTGATSALFTNTVTITTSTTDRDPDNNTDQTTTPLSQTIGLQVLKWAEPATAANGQTLTFTIRLRNSGDVPLNPVAFTDTLPAGLRYAGGAAPSGPDLIDGQRLVWNDVTTGVGLAAGAMQTLTFRAVISVGVGVTGTMVNQVSGTGSYPGGAITDTASTPVDVQPPGVTVNKTTAEHNRDAGVITFTIAITNTGPSVLDVIPLHDVYDPYYLGFISAEPAPDAPADDGRLDWADLTAPPPHGLGADLQPGEQFTVTVAFGILHDITSTTNTAVITDALDTYNNPSNDADDAEAVTNVPTAIELLYFRATAQPLAVLLEWATAIEIDNYGFYLYRGTGPAYGESSELAFVPAAGHGRSSGAAYSYHDLSIQPEVTYTYWLVDVDTEGRRTVHDPVTAAALPELIDRIYLPLIEKNWGGVR